MKKITVIVCVTMATLSLISCSPKQQQEEPQPSKAEQERQEKEYQKSMEDLRKMTEGSKAVLDKAPRQQPNTAKPQPQKQPAQTPGQDHQ